MSRPLPHLYFYRTSRTTVRYAYATSPLGPGDNDDDIDATADVRDVAQSGEVTSTVLVYPEARVMTSTQSATGPTSAHASTLISCATTCVVGGCSSCRFYYEILIIID